MMGRPPKIKINPPPALARGKRTGRGFYDPRPMRFEVFRGKKDWKRRAREILTALVNLPDSPDSDGAKLFTREYHDLRFGEMSDYKRHYRHESEPMKELMRLRGLYRQFWGPPADSYARALVVKENPRPNKSDGDGGYFQDPDEIKAAIAAVDPVKLRTVIVRNTRKGAFGDYNVNVLVHHLLGPYIFAGRSYMNKSKNPKDPDWPKHPDWEYMRSALLINWKTGRPMIAARGPIDYLSHAVFQNRYLLRECSYSRCGRGANGGKKLFIATKPNQFFCRATCNRNSDRERHTKWASENRASLRVDGLTSRKDKPKRRIPVAC
jgi:hypothetical protein